MGDFGSVAMCKRIFKDQTSDKGDVPFYKIGTFGQKADAYISKELFEEYKYKYLYPKEGDILISASGSIGKIVEFINKNEYFQDSNIVWLKHDERLSNIFLKYIYSIVKWHGIEGSTIKRLYNNNILNTSVKLPRIDEQKKIGILFTKLDNLITFHQGKFSRKSVIGVHTWEQRKVKEMIKISRGLTYKPEDINSNGIRVLRSSNIENDQFVLREDDVFVDKKVINIRYAKKNDILITAANGSSKLVGKHAIISGFSPKSTVHGGFMLLGSSNEPYFINASMSSKWYKNFIDLYVLGGNGAIANLNKNELEKYDFFVPGKQEIKLIGNFFRKLDNLITFHQYKYILCLVYEVLSLFVCIVNIFILRGYIMNEYKKDASESKYQEDLVKELIKYDWLAPDHLNGNIHKVTIQTLIDNWRKHLNRINHDVLEGVELTDNEFDQVLNKVNSIGNSFEAAKLLSIEDHKGKIDGIFRDKNDLVTRTQITLTIYKKVEVKGGDSVYEIAREVSSDKNRFDLILLINGLPLINIELKKASVDVWDAFRQFKRYYKDGEYIHNFLVFSQMMVISTPIETMYFATPKSYQDFNPSFVFHWADSNNNTINGYKEVCKEFLKIPNSAQMVGDYLVIDESANVENRRHMLMRSYQVKALNAIEDAALGWGGKDPHGGFIWHTTGSGKTITSFKTALYLSTRGNFDKIIFMVDRKELDANTAQSFKAYASYEPVEVDDTPTTYSLKSKLKSKKQGIVVTTTFKVNSLVKQLIEENDHILDNKRFVFIIDEAHRTTMGQMMGVIKDFFRKNGLFYGFTGTPLFEENHVTGKINNKSELINTTEKLFGPLLHQYTIDQAIKDKNVLGFHVDYINTGEFSSYDDLRDKLIEKVAQDNNKYEIEHEYYQKSELEIEKLAVKENILVYHDKTHIPKVVTNILDNWEKQSQNRKFNAILTVAYKSRVIEYYKYFKEELERRNSHLNIAVTFSFGNENKEDAVSDEFINELFEDYAKFANIKFINDKKGQENYFDHVINVAKRGGSGRHPQNIDLIIVADQLLTGYDAKLMNTLYVDRKLELQGLIQAYSRTNRIYGPDKEFGTIINYQYPRISEEMVNNALILYGAGGKSSHVLVAHYEVMVNEFKNSIDNLRTYLNDPKDWSKLTSDKDQAKAYLNTFKDTYNVYKRLTQYYEYKWDNDLFNIDFDTWTNYQGAYKNIKNHINPNNQDDEDETILLPSLDKTKLTGSQVIDSSTILQLIGNYVKEAKNNPSYNDERLRVIYEEISVLSNRGEEQEAKQLKEYVDNVVKQGIEVSNFEENYQEWKYTQAKEASKEFSKKYGVNLDYLLKAIENYELGNKAIPYIVELTKSINFDEVECKLGENKLKHNIALKAKLSEFIPQIKRKYLS